MVVQMISGESGEVDDGDGFEEVESVWGRVLGDLFAPLSADLSYGDIQLSRDHDSLFIIFSLCDKETFHLLRMIR